MAAHEFLYNLLKAGLANISFVITVVIFLQEEIRRMAVWIFLRLLYGNQSRHIEEIKLFFFF